MTSTSSTNKPDEPPPPQPEEPHLSDPNDNTSAKDVFVEWAQNATMHGVGQATNLDLVLWRRAIWALLVAVALGLLGWQISVLIDEFTDFELATNTEILVPKSLDFPQVTICNENPINSNFAEAEGIWEPANEEELSRISQRVENLIPRAWFNEVEIDPVADHWKPIITPWGRCWQFITTEKIFRPGSKGGLRFYADLDQTTYMNYTDLAGLRVFVTQRGTQINDQMPAEFASPGVEGFIGIRMIEYERDREDPWSRCISEAPVYSQPKCRAECLNSAVREECKCRNWGDQDVESLDMRFCTSADDACTNSAGSGETIDSCGCSKTPCHEVQFVTRISATAYSQMFLEKYVREYNSTREYFMSNFVSVHINYDTIQYEAITEYKAMSSAELLGSIGGTMGLMAGISVLSLFEIFGDLLWLRMIPRLFGYRHLYGIGHGTPVERSLHRGIGTENLNRGIGGESFPITV